MADVMLVLNAGSSSIKFSLFDAGAGETSHCSCAARSRGCTRAASSPPRTRDGARIAEQALGRRTRFGHDRCARLHRSSSCASHRAGHRLVAVGHRVVHGGAEFTRAGAGRRRRSIDALDKLRRSRRCTSRTTWRRSGSSPSGSRSCRRWPASTPPSTARSPRWRRPSRCRLDHRSRACGATASTACPTNTSRSVLPAISMRRRAAGKTVVAHLGNGASMCALAGGSSVASTMGFTAVDGLPMGTRCGNLDPGVILYLMDELKMDTRAIENLIYKQSGLLGVSGISSDMRTLLASDDPRRARPRSTCSSTASAANSGRSRPPRGARRPRVHRRHRREQRGADPRTRLPRGAWLGVELDSAANERGGPRISTPASRVRRG